MIIDYGFIGGLLGSFSDGRVTDSTWKCTRNYFNQWQLATFDDRAWPAAEASREQGDVSWGTNQNIASNAKWIWAGRYISSYKNTIVYCRKKLGNHVMFHSIKIAYMTCIYQTYFTTIKYSV